MAEDAKIVYGPPSGKPLNFGRNYMKVKKLIRKLNKAEFKHNLEKAKYFWMKLLKKSLKHKHTEAVR